MKRPKLHALLLLIAVTDCVPPAGAAPHRRPQRFRTAAARCRRNPRVCRTQQSPPASPEQGSEPELENAPSLWASDMTKLLGAAASLAAAGVGFAQASQARDDAGIPPPASLSSAFAAIPGTAPGAATAAAQPAATATSALGETSFGSGAKEPPLMAEQAPARGSPELAAGNAAGAATNAAGPPARPAQPQLASPASRLGAMPAAGARSATGGGVSPGFPDPRETGLTAQMPKKESRDADAPAAPAPDAGGVASYPSYAGNPAKPNGPTQPLFAEAAAEALQAAAAAQSTSDAPAASEPSPRGVSLFERISAKTKQILARGGLAK